MKKQKIIIKKYYLKNISPLEKEIIIKRYRFKLGNIKKQVECLTEDVRIRGDEAITDLIKKFDNININKSQFKVSKAEIKDAYKKVSPKIIQAIKDQIRYSKKFHTMQVRKKEWRMDIEKGVTVGEMLRPLDSVGIYVPGGKAPYPTVMQILAVPAKIAGVKKIVACTPRANPEVLIAADLAGVDEIYRIGGPQAIAAMAYGSETIPKVEKIVGPGNIYVTTAKIIVSNEVAIDMPAGPSEALIIADSKAKPSNVAADMLARMEHDEDATAVLITTDDGLANKVIKELEIQKEMLGRKEIINKSILKYSAIIIAQNMKEIIKFTNEYAPEHLEIMVKNPWKIMKKINNAGSIFLGYFAPVAVGDYASGVNHVIPTSQYAKAYSPIGVDTFLKRSEFEYLTKNGLQILNNKIVQTLAKVEGFDGHAKSVSVRFEKNKI